jgi:hypothetical protein
MACRGARQASNKRKEENVANDLFNNTSKDAYIRLAECSGHIERLGLSLEKLSRIDDPIVRSIFSPGTHKTAMELSALGGRINYVMNMRIASTAASEEAKAELKAASIAEKRAVVVSKSSEKVS